MLSYLIRKNEEEFSIQETQKNKSITLLRRKNKQHYHRSKQKLMKFINK